MEEIIGKIFPQNCGDDLKVIESLKIDNKTFYRCQFLKYPCEIIKKLDHIKRGVCNNPQIEQIEFVQKEWKQNCGDSLRILRKTEQKNKNGKGEYLWEVEFINYPYKLFVTKSQVLSGCVDNPQIENQEFIGKEFMQNCGDTLVVLEKSNSKIITEYQNYYLYKVRFKEYFFETLASKRDILRGSVQNLSLPWKSKENLEKYIEENFKEKPTLDDLYKSFNKPKTTICNFLTKYDLHDLIKYTIESKEENKIREYIKSIYQKCPEIPNRSLLPNGREIDIYLEELKLGFEYNGNYWHSNEIKSNEYHQEKSLLLKEKGIDLVHIWEWEWFNKEEIIKSIIKTKLGFFDKIIYARKCQIKEIDTENYRNFCLKNHLQGNCGAKIKLGLFYEKELVQIMSFGIPRFTDNYEWEILRECSKLNYCIVGGKEKLWKYFVKKYNPKNCLSYCDFGKFTGKSYLKIGFKFLRLNKPGFVWWENKTNGNVFWRTPSKNEEYKKKYLKLYDCGQLVFVWTSSK